MTGIANVEEIAPSDYLTLLEFSAAVKRTKMAVYNKIKKKILTRVLNVKGRIWIHKDEIETYRTKVKVMRKRKK